MKHLFRLEREERLPALLLLLVLLALHGLLISKFFGLFADFDEHSWRTFMRNFHMSGFDPITYDVVTRWHLGYDTLRHPLLPFLVWPLYAANQLLWALTGANCAPLLTGALLLFCGFYSMVFLYRTLRQVVGTGRWAALLLTAFFLGFAYVVTALIVPDHFCLSLFLLTLTLWRAGTLMGEGRAFTWQEAALLFVLTAGVTLSNGVAVLLCVVFTNGRRCLRRRFLWGVLVVPPAVLFAVGVALRVATDPALPGAASTVEEQFAWTHVKASRADQVVENLFGESFQLHRKHVLGDVLNRRPLIVRYTWRAQYAAEAVLLLLFAAGVWVGRRQRFLWLLMAVFAFNLLLHVGLGFALSEVYIMTCHWAFVVPLSVGWLLRPQAGRWQRVATELAVGVLTFYLWLYHGVLLYRYLTWPLAA